MGIFVRVLCVCIASGLFFATLGTGISTACCNTSKTVLQKSQIAGYHIQKVGICPVEAVVFNTVLGKRVCSDPKKPWVKRAVKYINSKKLRTTVTAPTTVVLFTNNTEPTRNATTFP